MTELGNYVKQRREFIHIFPTVADIRTEMLRNVTETVQLIDHYPGPGVP